MDGVFYINKPKGMTSFDVVAKLRRKINQKSIGHTGTLDPNAEGLLIVLVGKACKALPYCEHNQKEYRATMKFGEKRSTGDIWGEVIDTRRIIPISKEKFEKTLESFLGFSMQIPPMTSAIKIQGKKLLDYQREGKKIAVPAREIEVESLRCLEFDGETASIEALVSKGTYIRTLCEDIAEKTGNLGVMTALVRTKIGPIDLSQAQTIDEIDEHSIPHSITEVLQGTLPMIEVDDAEHVKQGKKVRLNHQAELVLLTKDQQILAAYEKEEDYVYRCKRGLW